MNNIDVEVSTVIEMYQNKLAQSQHECIIYQSQIIKLQNTVKELEDKLSNSGNKGE